MAERVLAGRESASSGLMREPSSSLVAVIFLFLARLLAIVAEPGGSKVSRVVSAS